MLVNNYYDITIVLYAPKIGSCGIDIQRLTTREDLWLKSHGTLSLINTPIPWYPEVAGYAVCKLTVGMPFLHTGGIYMYRHHLSKI